MKTFKLFFLLIAGVSFTCYAQDKEATVKYYELSLGQASDNTFTKSEPAQFIATFPANDTIPNSILANGYIGIGKVWERDDLIEKLDFNYEIQKNTLVDSEQDVKQYGFTYTAQIIRLVPRKSPLGIPASGSGTKGYINYFLTAYLKYSEDNVKDKEGIQTGIGLTINRLQNRKGGKDGYYFLNTLEKFPKQTSTLGSIVQFSHNHNLGVGYIGSEKIFLANLDLQINAFPLSKLFREEFSQEKLLFLAYNYNGRGLISGDTEEDIRPLRTFSIGSEYEIEENKSSIQIGYNVIKGANPYKGLGYQDYSTISLKFKFNFDINK